MVNVMEEGKTDVLVKLKREQRQKDQPPKLHTDLPALTALPTQNIVCSSYQSDNF